MEVAAVNEYEAARQRRIEHNKAQLAALGLGHARSNNRSALAGPIAGWTAPTGGAETAPQPPRLPRRRTHTEALQPAEATRASSRKRKKSRWLRGSDDEASEDEGSAENGAAEGNSADVVAAAVAPLVLPAAVPRARTLLPESTSTHAIAAPFTLRSIGVTIWEIGSIKRDSFAPRFWSSKGCLYHHAYPVGFRAQKHHFGRPYTMHILAGQSGPVFRVVDDTSGEFFDGESPTRPWTGVCQSKRLGTRISGPLFFGFSDPMTQRAIAQLYTPDELAAARAGSTVASLAPSAEECAVADFCRVEGLGEASSIALAHTRCLLPNGERVRSLKQLQDVAHADGGTALSRFLLTSLEVPESVRRWPLWAPVFVPKIIAALLSDDPTVPVRGRPSSPDDKAAGSDTPNTPPASTPTQIPAPPSLPQSAKRSRSARGGIRLSGPTE